MMDYTVEGQSIQFVVNDSKTPDEAKARYTALEGVLMPKDVADGIFADALKSKFPSKSASVLSEINDLDKKLQSL